MITSFGQLRWISYCTNTAYFMSVKIGTTPETLVKSRLSRVVPIIYHSHGAISYGHIGADIITLCSMLRIPISMHNVDEADIFRPAAWNAFGMDKEGQDYRACAAYGPMYRNIR